MNYDLARMVAQHRRTNAILRPIVPTLFLREELRWILIQVPQAWAAELRSQILPAYAAAVAALTRDAEENAEDRHLEEALAALLLLMRRRVAALLPLALPWAARTEEWHRRRWASAVRAAGGVDVSPFLTRFDVEGNIQLGARRSRTEIENLNAYVAQRTGTLIWTGVAQRIAPPKMAQMLNDVIGIARRKAANEALYQTEALSADLDRTRQEQAGIRGYIWAHSLLPNPREWHLTRHGKRYEWEHPPFDGPPGTQRGCRCRPRAVIDVESLRDLDRKAA